MARRTSAASSSVPTDAGGAVNHDETVREFLRRRGCPDEVVARGLLGLVEQWEKTAEAVETGYSLGLDDYLNDMDSRQLIEEALEFASEIETLQVKARLAAADKRMRAALKPRPSCLWGEGIGRYHDWSPDRNWWYFSVPRAPGPDLAAELK